MAFYELVNLFSGNRVGEYDSIAAAFADIREAVAQYGDGALPSLALGYEDDAGHTELVAEGDELVRRAMRAVASSGPVRDAA